ncbi:chromosomal replication initiator protein DnaA [Magnetospira sp. QH-2]|uniref:chromosomal replication initiator protein DnaA n=1 Tax=Magnetospira sp. (strain QH-2) TaxID=1288970 RepID=UPI0003E80A27|nr:chromosomal replication initiator protein DnaA [Magnetospira sp. QH-2]CCQ71995.1 Chromosomal replication initiator protein dnaA [Magnetospira sp. QH-2]
MNADGSHLEGQWTRVCTRMRGEIGEAAFRSWLKPMAVHGAESGMVRLAAPTRFMRDWVLDHYADRLRAFWGDENPEIRTIDVVVQQSRTPSVLKESSVPESPAAGRAEAGAARALNQMQADDGISVPLDPRFTFDRFVIGKPNEFAYAAAQRVAETKNVAFNPLFLYGGVGLGKTHLMHAIAAHIRDNDPNRRVVYLSAEKFMYRFIRALREQRAVDFKEHFRSVDVLMIDDVQFIGGKESTQEEFFHTFNALVDQGRQIVVSADKSPSDLEGMEERLKSRLGCGLVADIHATTYELRLGILESKAEHLGIQVPQKVSEFLAHKITSNVRELEGALNRVIAHSQLVGRDISVESTQEVLHDLLRANNRRITIEEIQKKVAEHFNIKMADMHSARRARAVARPRQVAMYLSKQLTSRSLPEIGRKFGGRDHTTVMHAVRKVDELCDGDAGFAEDVELLRRMLGG